MHNVEGKSRLHKTTKKQAHKVDKLKKHQKLSHLITISKKKLKPTIKVEMQNTTTKSNMLCEPRVIINCTKFSVKHKKDVQ